VTETYFNPGCALGIYRPEFEDRILGFLNDNYGPVALHKVCCHHDPRLEAGAVIINACAGCDRRFRSLYEGISTISIWEVLDGLGTFPFPRYDGLALSVHDPCPVRQRPPVHQAVRSLLRKMNIGVVEAEFHGSRSVCCGDDFYPTLPVDQVHKRMKARADSMPCQEVAVYCVSCIKSMYIGGKTPRHLTDLLFGQATEPQIYDTMHWHEQLQKYIDAH
jgi:Fe-S oxidoreductase